METRPLDAFDDEQMRAFYDVSWRAEMEDGRPWNGHWTFEELADQLRTPSGDHRLDGVAAYDGETLVGAGVIGRSLHTNLDKAWVFPMVDPPCRRRGAGSALSSTRYSTGSGMLVTRAMPQRGHLPGLSECTSLCSGMGQV